MAKEDLEKMAAKYDAAYERHYEHYQQAGISRDLREAQKAEDIADACRQALAAADDHESALQTQSLILRLAREAEQCKAKDYDPELAKVIIDHIISVAHNSWGYRLQYQ